MAASHLLLRTRVSLQTVSQVLRSSSSELSSSIPGSLISSAPKRCISRIPRLLLDSCCPVSMLPLHSAVASARLKSILAAQSQSWGWVPQGPILTKGGYDLLCGICSIVAIVSLSAKRVLEIKLGG